MLLFILGKKKRICSQSINDPQMYQPRRVHRANLIDVVVQFGLKNGYASNQSSRLCFGNIIQTMVFHRRTFALSNRIFILILEIKMYIVFRKYIHIQDYNVSSNQKQEFNVLLFIFQQRYIMIFLTIPHLSLRYGNLLGVGNYVKKKLIFILFLFLLQQNTFLCSYFHFYISTWCRLKIINIFSQCCGSILMWIRIRIRGSTSGKSGSGSDQRSNKFLFFFFIYLCRRYNTQNYVFIVVVIFVS